MTLLSLNNQQEKFLNSLTCQRLHAKSVNRGLIQFFCNYENPGLVRDLRQGWKADQNGETAYYIIKDPANRILMYFSLRCGSLHRPDSYQYYQSEYKKTCALYDAAVGKKDARKWALEEIEKYKKGGEVPKRMVDDLREYRDELKYLLKALKKDAKNDPTQMAIQTQKNFSGVEMVHYCVNDWARDIWKNSCVKNRPMGQTLFWRFILPLIQQINGLVGCQYVYLFAAENERKPKLVKYYREKLHFERMEELISRKPAYDVGCDAMCQELSVLERYRKDFFDNFNREELKQDEKTE